MLKGKNARQLRIIYLARRPELWEHLPPPPRVIGRASDPPGVFDTWLVWKRRYNRRIVNALKADGLIAKTTFWADVNVPGLIEDAIKIKNELFKLQ